jgi:hypothetical protein
MDWSRARTASTPTPRRASSAEGANSKRCVAAPFVGAPCPPLTPGLACGSLPTA